VKFPPFACHFFLLSPKCIPQYTILKTVTQYFSLNVRDEVSRPHKTRKLIILCNLIFTFFNKKIEVKKIFNETAASTYSSK